MVCISYLYLFSNDSQQFCHRRVSTNELVYQLSLQLFLQLPKQSEFPHKFAHYRNTSSGSVSYFLLPLQVRVGGTTQAEYAATNGPSISQSINQSITNWTKQRQWQSFEYVITAR